MEWTIVGMTQEQSINSVTVISVDELVLLLELGASQELKMAERSIVTTTVMSIKSSNSEITIKQIILALEEIPEINDFAILLKNKLAIRHDS